MLALAALGAAPIPSPSASSLIPQNESLQLHVTSRTVKTHYQFMYTSYLCKGAKNSVHHNACAASPSDLENGALKKAMRAAPHSTHILAYGPSWMRQIAMELVRHEGSGNPPRMIVHAENNADKTCHCELESVECPCGDFATYVFESGLKVTQVINYEKLQTRAHKTRLKAFLRGEKTEHVAGMKFTHAMVMEPHEGCYFTKCGATGPCEGCMMDKWKDIYGCGWSEELWEIMIERFPHVVHVVPWVAPTDYGVHASSRAIRLRPYAEKHACEAESTDPAKVSIAASGEVSSAHQCTIICDDSPWPPKHETQCHNGSPTLMAFHALKRMQDWE